MLEPSMRRYQSNIVAVVACRNQETAFWLLAALVEDILAPGTYDPHLMGCLVSIPMAPDSAEM